MPLLGIHLATLDPGAWGECQKDSTKASTQLACVETPPPNQSAHLVVDQISESRLRCVFVPASTVVLRRGGHPTVRPEHRKSFQREGARV
eukprot:364818-Chlamydomonas_euryale.AAC.21